MRRLAGLALVGLLLAGCAPAAPESGPRPSPTAGSTTAPASPTTATVTVTPEPELDPELSELADLAEQQATRAPEAPPVGPVLGGDVSWPQCPKGMGIPERRTQGKPMPVPTAQYVVVGLTNGPGFTANPCLAQQVAWVRERRLMIAAYAVASLPDAATVERHASNGPYDGRSRLGALRNTGYQQARFNVASMRRAGFPTPIVWIDVEPVPDFDWGSDTAANAAVVQGAARGYLDAGYRIGVYSTPYLWEQVVGELQLRVPEWRAAGETSIEEALSRCGPSWTIQGGPPVLAQWVADDRDHDVTCPGVEAELSRWFHQF